MKNTADWKYQHILTVGQAISIHFLFIPIINQQIHAGSNHLLLGVHINRLYPSSNNKVFRNVLASYRCDWKVNKNPVNSLFLQLLSMRAVFFYRKCLFWSLLLSGTDIIRISCGVGHWCQYKRLSIKNTKCHVLFIPFSLLAYCNKKNEGNVHGQVDI